MNANLFFDFTSFLIFVFGVLLALVGILKKNLGLGAIGFVLVTSSGNSKAINELFLDFVGFGPSILILLFISVLVFGLTGFSLRGYPRCLLNIKGIMLGIMLPILILSLLKAYDVIGVYKSVLSFAIVAITGWLFIGKIAAKHPCPRILIANMTNAMGLLSLVIIVLMLVIVGPIVLLGLSGSTSNQLIFFEMTVSRLQTEGFNATGIGATSAIALFWAFTLLVRSASVVKKILAIIFIIISTVALLWSGARGAIFAVLFTFCFIFILSGYWKKMRTRNLIVVFFGVIFLVYILLPYFIGNLDRGHGNERNMSIVDLFVESRIESQGREAFELIMNPTLFGIGYNSLSTSGLTGINIESYWLKAWVELGVVGSGFHIILFFVLSVSVIRADLLASKLSRQWDFLPSMIIVFVWANSLTSWGFILPYGNTMIYLALMSVSTVYLSRVHNKSKNKLTIKTMSN